MARNTFMWVRAAAVIAFAAQVASQNAQCYYPNGNRAPSTEKPCSSAEGSACCPDNWQCLDNGLCYYPTNNLYGRYSCTDQSWNSPGCPANMCTYGGQAGGGESIKQCSNHNNDWCCNADDTNVKCCQESPAPRPFFALQDGKPYATIGANQASTVPTISGITGLASGTGSGSSASRPSAPASSSEPSTAGSRSQSVTAASATPFTSIQTSLSSGTAGVETVFITSIVTPSSNPTAVANNNSSGGGSSNIGLIVGCAVGIPLALALIGIIVWMLRKRRQQKANPYRETPEMDGDNSSAFAGGAAAKLGKKQEYRHSRPGTAEIDGNPVGPGRPVSTIKGHAELESGAGFQPGHGTPYAPDTVGLGGGNGNPDRSTWGSLPPQYTPAGQHAEASELDGTSVLPVINEKKEGEQQYQAYRPPQEGLAELPTVKTPPEDVEKQIHK